MKRSISGLLAATTLILAGIPSANADTMSMKDRLGVEGGFGLAMPFQTRSWVDNTGHGWGLEGAVDYHFWDHTALEFAWNHLEMTTKGNSILNTYTIGGKFDFCPDSVWHPFFGIGVGYGESHGSTSGVFNVKNWTALGKIGVNYFIGDAFAVGLMGQYHWLQSNTASMYNLEPITALLTLSYYFPAFGGEAKANTAAVAPAANPPSVTTTQSSAVVEKPVPSGHTFVHFDFDRSNLKPEFRGSLDDLASHVKNDGSAKIQVDGYADSIGTKAYNMGLSKRRAMTVKNYLVRHHNLASKQIHTTAYGESKPIADNSTAEGRAKNRRVEAYISGYSNDIRLGSLGKAHGSKILRRR